MKSYINVSNILEYKNNKSFYLYDKICMLKIQNANLLLMYLGEDYYYEYLEQVISEIYIYLQKDNINHSLYPYILDNSTLIVAGKMEMEEEKFLEITRRLYKKFYYIKLNRPNLPMLMRFAVVIRQGDMMKCAIEALYAERNLQRNYIVYEEDISKDADIRQELNVINTIYWAIENDGVIPYYQGIYNNKKRCIDKYEALMRIRDRDGNIYAPVYFMEVAKKYNVYTKLSKIMIKKIFQEVENRNMNVSVNLSIYDISSSEFKKVLFKLLESRQSDALIIFEIIEDEVFKDIFLLKQFIKEVKKYDIKIAIDDFGAGYSNLAKTTEICPDYIKVDGSITKNIHKCKKNRHILKSIIELAKNMNAYTVVEYVDNPEIQGYLEEYKVDFSQGYYFSRPLPIEQLEL
ncbi:EAL domain-containing protein [Niameybacter massiliensis]|uniref:EAL domain-containing protein n=1 Tax=Holtiella tumoricola TaxID=3018743 RepID=A0AA42J2H6_9FIRM|nr:EAL domain-containing protein [Holtiella tumoricola]MDA3733203.1 EAL domain-containing protein [Holtiella tumoricola]